MFYTGARLNDTGERAVDRVCHVLRPLRVGQGAGTGARRRTRGGTRSTADGNWHDEAFRDPWVLADPDGDGWHMLITARANHGDVGDRGRRRPRVVGRPGALGAAGAAVAAGAGLRPARGVPAASSSTAGRCCSSTAWSGTCRRRRGPRVSRAGSGSPTRSRRSGPTTSPAPAIDDPSLYVGKFITDRETGETKFLAFRNETGGQFIGEITDPYAVTWDGDRLVLQA